MIAKARDAKCSEEKSDASGSLNDELRSHRYIRPTKTQARLKHNAESDEPLPLRCEPFIICRALKSAINNWREVGISDISSYQSITVRVVSKVLQPFHGVFTDISETKNRSSVYA